MLFCEVTQCTLVPLLREDPVVSWAHLYPEDELRIYKTGRFHIPEARNFNTDRGRT
jgi:hypothetical protein